MGTLYCSQTWKTVLAPSKAKLSSAPAKILKHLIRGRASYPHLLPIIIIHKGCYRDLNVPFDHFFSSCQCVTRAEFAGRSNQKAINAQVSIYIISRIQNPSVNIKNCGNCWQIKDGCYRFQKYFCFQQNTFLITFLLAVIFHKPV